MSSGGVVVSSDGVVVSSDGASYNNEFNISETKKQLWKTYRQISLQDRTVEEWIMSSSAATETSDSAATETSDSAATEMTGASTSFEFTSSTEMPYIGLAEVFFKLSYSVLMYLNTKK